MSKSSIFVANYVSGINSATVLYVHWLPMLSPNSPIVISPDKMEIIISLMCVNLCYGQNLRRIHHICCANSMPIHLFSHTGNRNLTTVEPFIHVSEIRIHRFNTSIWKDGSVLAAFNIYISCLFKKKKHPLNPWFRCVLPGWESSWHEGPGEA